MSDGLLKQVLLTFSAASGISFVCWIIFLIKQNGQKDVEIKIKEYEVQKIKLKGEIDDASLLSVVKRADKRRGSDN